MHKCQPELTLRHVAILNIFPFNYIFLTTVKYSTYKTRLALVPVSKAAGSQISSEKLIQMPQVKQHCCFLQRKSKQSSFTSLVSIRQKY